MIQLATSMNLLPKKLIYYWKLKAVNAGNKTVENWRLHWPVTKGKVFCILIKSMTDEKKGHGKLKA